MKQINQCGFSTVIVITVILLIGIIGFAAWRLHEINLQKTERTQNTDSQMQTDPNEGYVVIKEWGVRFKPVEGLRDVIYYRIDNNGDNFFAFTTKDLAESDKNCSPNPTHIALGGLTRAKEPFMTGNNYGPINGYYYSSRASQAPCSLRPNELEGPIITKFLQSIETLEAVK